MSSATKGALPLQQQQTSCSTNNSAQWATRSSSTSNSNNNNATNNFTSTTSSQQQQHIRSDLLPTQEQIRLAQLIEDKKHDHPDVQDTVEKILNVVENSTQEDALIALHDSDYDVQKAVALLIEKGHDVASEWHTAGSKKNKNTKMNNGTGAGDQNNGTSSTPNDIQENSQDNRQIITKNQNTSTRPKRSQRGEQQPNSDFPAGDTNSNNNFYNNNNYYPRYQNRPNYPHYGNNGTLTRPPRYNNDAGRYSGRLRRGDGMRRGGVGGSSRYYGSQRGNRRGGGRYYNSNNMNNENNVDGENTGADDYVDSQSSDILHPVNNHIDQNSNPSTHDSAMEVGTWNNNEQQQPQKRPPIQGSNGQEIFDVGNWNGETIVYERGGGNQGQARKAVQNEPDLNNEQQQHQQIDLNVHNQQRHQRFNEQTNMIAPNGQFDRVEAERQIKNAIGIPQKPPQSAPQNMMKAPINLMDSLQQSKQQPYSSYESSQQGNSFDDSSSTNLHPSQQKLDQLSQSVVVGIVADAVKKNQQHQNQVQQQKVLQPISTPPTNSSRIPQVPVIMPDHFDSTVEKIDVQFGNLEFDENLHHPPPQYQYLAQQYSTSINSQPQIVYSPVKQMAIDHQQQQAPSSQQQLTSPSNSAQPRTNPNVTNHEQQQQSTYSGVVRVSPRRVSENIQQSSMINQQPPQQSRLTQQPQQMKTNSSQLQHNNSMNFLFMPQQTLQETSNLDQSSYDPTPFPIIDYTNAGPYMMSLNQRYIISQAQQQPQQSSLSNRAQQLSSSQQTSSLQQPQTSAASANFTSTKQQSQSQQSQNQQLNKTPSIPPGISLPPTAYQMPPQLPTVFHPYPASLQGYPAQSYDYGTPDDRLYSIAAASFLQQTGNYQPSQQQSPSQAQAVAPITQAPTYHGGSVTPPVTVTGDAKTLNYTTRDPTIIQNASALAQQMTLLPQYPQPATASYGFMLPAGLYNQPQKEQQLDYTNYTMRPSTTTNQQRTNADMLKQGQTRVVALDMSSVNYHQGGGGTQTPPPVQQAQYLYATMAPHTPTPQQQQMQQTASQQNQQQATQHKQQNQQSQRYQQQAPQQNRNF
ncbi:unnamed protein product [Didymodactylos carnosus]|uniref:Uncharacterized protein n=2 Tax=Didymodactylos carnosus TaxID=1234261 RepID=A0A8S2GMM4_9BILA|nr:unnamed protein product [Didymodactylos carnosus]CAF3537377.1 unnamed protein product [Didymodactylos carnosus]